MAADAELARWLDEAWSRQASLRHVTVDGARVAYRDWGRPAGAAQGLVFVHGFLAHARWWDHIAPRFADRYHAIATDLSGMGDSEWRERYPRALFAHETIAAIRDAGMSRATIVAHSFGSLSSLHAARLEPELVARVIVLDSHLFRTIAEYPTDPVRPARTYATLAEALSRYRLRPPGTWPVPAIHDYVARHSLRETPDGRWGWKFDPRLFARDDSAALRASVRGLPAPVDFIHAARSEVVGPEALAAVVANLPGLGTPVTVPLSHHHLMLEQPVGLVAALDGLLANPR